MIDKIYFARSQSGQDTECFETIKEARETGMRDLGTPLVIMKLVANPVASILTARDLPEGIKTVT